MDFTTSDESGSPTWNSWLSVSNQNRLEVFSSSTSFEVCGADDSTNFGRIVSSKQDVLELQSSLDSPLILVRILRNDITYETGVEVRRPDIEIKISSQYITQSPPLIGKTSFVKIFETLLSTLKYVEEELPSLRWGALDVFAVLQAHSHVLTQITNRLVMKRYCPGFGLMLEEYEGLIDSLQQFVETKFLLNHNTKKEIFEDVTSNIWHHFDRLSDWNCDEEFYFGKSEKFAGVEDINDFLPKTSPPEDCSICVGTPLVDTLNFAILSDCRHVFCARCLGSWFRRSSTCPMCRSESLWMSRDTYLELQAALNTSALE